MATCRPGLLCSHGEVRCSGGSRNCDRDWLAYSCSATKHSRPEIRRRVIMNLHRAIGYGVQSKRTQRGERYRPSPQECDL